jgi:hypothetical protein
MKKRCGAMGLKYCWVFESFGAVQVKTAHENLYSVEVDGLRHVDKFFSLPC